ncbi:hypothetical protein EIM50_21520 [Pseudoxanthomonas sp. SGD-10]|nr:hypothetical protein EIM50_21520 [Pseudoxanthomonas sp. SGD-10]
MKYESTQVGWMLILLMPLIIVAIAVGYNYQLGQNPLPKNVFQLLVFIFTLIIINFYKLKIRVDESGINILYGVGLIHINIDPDVVQSVRVVKTSWLAGFGIRFTLKGMLYNIQGRDAVELVYSKDGKKKNVTIGCRNPEALKLALQAKYKIS